MFNNARVAVEKVRKNGKSLDSLVRVKGFIDRAVASRGPFALDPIPGASAVFSSG